MRFSALRIIGVLLTAAAFAAPLPAVAADTIPFVSDGGRIEVQGSVDGSAPAPMLVGLGAGVDVLSSALGQRYVLVGGKFVRLTQNGERVVLPLGVVQSLAIGGVRLDAPYVGISNALDGTSVSGIISATAFRNITATFDFRQNEIVIEDAQSFPQRIVLSARVPAILEDDLGIGLAVFARFDFGDGKTGICEIDTASSGITLDKAFAASIGVRASADGSASVSSIALTGAPQTTLVDPSVRVSGLAYDCAVGNVFWAGRSFTLDLPNRFIYVESKG
jgi:hypothetical protein